MITITYKKISENTGIKNLKHKLIVNSNDIVIDFFGYSYLH